MVDAVCLGGIICVDVLLAERCCVGVFKDAVGVVGGPCEIERSGLSDRPFCRVTSTVLS